MKANELTSLDDVYLVRKPFNEIEDMRTYIYEDGSKVSFKNVVALWEKSDGSGTTHRLETKDCDDGNFHIVAPGWKAITLKVKGFTF